MEGELVAAEVRLRRAGGDDQAVVGELPRAVEQAGSRRRGARGRRRRPRRGRPRALRWWRRTSRSGGAMFPCDRTPGRDLVEQRLEEVVRLPVDHGRRRRAPGAAPSRRRGRRSRRPTITTRWRAGHRLRRALTCSVAGRRIIPSRPLLMPSCRWSTVVVASTSSPSSTLPHGRGELERHDHARRFEVADDVQDPVGHLVDAGRREAHLRVLDDVEEVGRAQVLVARSRSRCRGCRRRSSARSSSRPARPRTSRRSGRSGRER